MTTPIPVTPGDCDCAANGYGIVDAGLLPGDHHQIVREERCKIELGAKPGVRVVIEAAS